ncbi:MAG TPA: TQO small subunit DoxD [Candidatus Eremiobacteraceae bacterium]|nr:TQO small subunit DoxD [Candidatus Eremiobacteraceae bacterium]
MNDDRTRSLLTVLRIYVGALWLAYGSSKLEPNWAAPNGEFYEAAKFSAGSIHGPMHDFIANVVLPHQQLFGLLIAYGETLVGISLTLGLLTRAGAIGGMFLSANYFFAQGKYQVYLGIESIEALLFVCCALLLAGRTGEYASLDALLFRRRRDETVDEKLVEKAS